MTVYLTRHAGIRCLERRITRDDIAAALCGRVWIMPDGSQLLYDPRSRVTLAVEADGAISTVMRLRKKQRKRLSW